MSKAVTVLGTGLMGAGMTRSLLRAGLSVTVWNRHEDKAQTLHRDGATVAADPATAVADADVVLTMLFDADAAAGVMGVALPAVRENSVWLQCGTVGLAGANRLAELAEQRGVAYLDSPVLGTRQPAEDGKLVVLVGGPSRLRDRVRTVLEAIGARTIWVGERPDDGHRLKLVANSWLLSITAAAAQAVGLSRGLGINPQLFLDAIANGPLDSGYAQLKGTAMINGDFTPAFTVRSAVKDAGLVIAAMDEAGLNDALMGTLRHLFGAAGEDGHGDDDMAAVLRALEQD